ncbi:MAG: circularly permuted type 2 ATP-grasp protein, partial [Gammaproteobacteria bacterium]|nr:circularly permuted type 2 ATP-grasp protein [Gammaproteobacteria bacterium]
MDWRDDGDAADGEPRPDGASPFDGYELDPGFYDEMVDAAGSPRPHCRTLVQAIETWSPGELGRLHQRVARSLLHEGITFTVYGDDESIERVFPVDCVPRLLPASEWALIERGLIQRVQALNLFLADVYGPGHILRDGIVPTELVRGCPNYRPEMEGVKVPLDAYVSVCGSDLVRVGDAFLVLEDNLRVQNQKRCSCNLEAIFPLTL